METIHDKLKSAHKVIFPIIFSKSDYNRELAEDICHDAYIKAIEKEKEGLYKENGTFNSWVAMIAKNLLVDYRRKETRKKIVNTIDISVGKDYYIENKLIVDPMIDWDIVNHDKIKAARLVEVIKKLSPEQQEVIDYYILQGFKFIEMVPLIGVSLNTILGRMRYALINLRKHYMKIYQEVVYNRNDPNHKGVVIGYLQALNKKEVLNMQENKENAAALEEITLEKYLEDKERVKNKIKELKIDLEVLKLKLKTFNIKL